MRLSGKTALVTGSSQGIGAEVARRLAEEGADVVVNYRSHPDEAAAVANGIRQLGRRCAVLQADLARVEEVRNLVTASVAQLGRLDILVNNAGIEKNASFTDVSEQDYDAILDVNAKGVFFATKHAIPHMIAAGRGSIVNFSSIYGLIGNDEFTPYHVAKGAVSMQTKQDAASYGRYGIRVNSVHPSTVRTPLVEGIAAAYPGGIEAYERMMTANQSIRRLGRPIEVAYAVLFLASDESQWVTGVNLPVDGGYTAR